MRLPDLIDPEFKPLEACASGRELYEKLSGSPGRLVRFFVQAVVDESWLARHEGFSSLALAQFTTLFAQGRLAKGPAKEVVAAFHQHRGALGHLLPKNYPVKVTEEVYLTSPLVIGVMSPYLFDLMYNDSTGKGLVLADITPELFSTLLNYMEEGKWESLWKYRKEELEDFLAVAERFKLFHLVEECQKVLRRYIDAENVCEMLLESFRKGRSYLKEEAIEQFNSHVAGAKLYDLQDAGIGFEFLNNRGKTIEYFHALKPIIAELKLSGSTTQFTELFDLLKETEKTTSFNLSLSLMYNPALLSIPEGIDVLNLSQCEWLTDALFKEITRRLPWLVKLDLSGNTQLTFLSWNELRNLSQLKELDLSNLRNISEGEKALIRSSLMPGAQLRI